MTIVQAVNSLCLCIATVGKRSHLVVAVQGIRPSLNPANMSRQRPTFEALPYYDEDGSNNLDLLAKVKAELAKEQKLIGQRVAADNDPRIPPQFPLFSVCHFGDLVFRVKLRFCRKIHSWPLNSNVLNRISGYPQLIYNASRFLLQRMKTQPWKNGRRP